MHFRQFSPNLHNIFVQEAVLCRELEKSPSCMDYPIRTSPEYVLFLCRTRLKRASCTPSHRVAFEMLAQKQVPAAICITFHTNFTIRPGGHSNFRRFPSFPVSRSGPAFRKRININFSLSISAKPPNRQPRHTLHCTP